MCQNSVLLKQFTGPFAFLVSFQLVFSSLSEIFPERKNWMLWMCWRVVSINGKSLQRPIKCFYLWGKGTLPIGRGWHLRGKALQEGYVQLRSPPSWTSVSDLYSNFVATSFICWLLCLSLSPLDLLPLLTMEENLPGQRGPSSPHLWTLPEVVGPFSPPPEKYMIYILY